MDDELNLDVNMPSLPSEPVEKSRVKFELRDWLILAASLGLALLWREVFGLESFFIRYLPALGAAAFVAAIWACVLLYLGRNAKWNRWNIGLTACVALLTLACVIYGNSFVRLINFLLILCGSALAFFSLSAKAVNALNDASVIGETFKLTFSALFSGWGKPFSATASLIKSKDTRMRGVFIGAIAVLPLLVVVILLLASADAVFGSLFSGIADFFVDLQSGEHIFKLLSTLILTLMSFSALWFLRNGKQGEVTKEAKSEHTIPAVPYITALILMCIIYIVFVCIQFAYLFGGIETASMNGGYAQYARNGFFQLVWVSAINLAVVLFMNRRGSVRLLRIFSAILLALTAVILFSAVWRMSLYISAFGMSLLRAMTLWAMVFITVCMVLAALKVFKPGFRFWPWFAAVGLCGWILFNFINIDARIADWNVNAYISGDIDEVDYEYLGSLSPDTIPALERLYEHLPEVELKRCIGTLKLEAPESWTEWNLSFYTGK